MNLSRILQNATAAIKPTYFSLDIAGGPSLFRERVYCYELYHQMRRIWPPESVEVLNGEIDKSAHPILNLLGKKGATKPDFLVHSPGTMTNNFAILEVKHSITKKGIKKDIETLDFFMKKAGYQRAIYLIFGAKTTNGEIEKIKAVADEYAELKPIELWLHTEAGQPARHHATLTATGNSGDTLLNY